MSVMRYGCVLLRAGLVLILLARVVPVVQAVEVRRVPGMPPEEPITTGSDAAGGCDGIKNGRWGFHTNIVEKPWWCVDLGQAQSLDRIVIWNRCDETAPRNSHLVLSLSGDGTRWRTAYTHDGTTFFGYTDAKPLVVALAGQTARFVRIQLPGKDYLHLDEVEVFGSAEPEKNLALRCPADQQSVSPWSATEPFEGNSAFNLIRDKLRKALPDEPAELVNEFCLLQEEIALDRSGTPQWQWRKGYLATQVLRPELFIAVSDRHPGDVVLRRTRAMIAHMRQCPNAPDLAAEAETLAAIETQSAELKPDDLVACWELFRRAVSLRRRVVLADPLLDFETILFTKRVPGTFNHMSDQYYGWFSRPGGGIYILRDFKGDAPIVECLTETFTEPGSFLRPCLSYDARKVLFAWCRHYPALAGEPDKLNKDNVPADAFYHVFEMNIDGTGVRQLTFGKYDDFDARYLPDGRIVFLSTRRGQFIQCSPSTAQQTVATEDLPDSYVRCGGGPERPVAIYTLHTMDADGGNLCAISPFENFEWTPSIADDGTILHSRWDYVDRYNNAFMSLWAINPDGTSPRLVYGNFTWSPHTTFEARCIPNSHKLIFTASAHHAQTMGSLVLLDPTVGTEGDEPITRLTPEIPFPEIEGWGLSYYANPWPLSEQLYLVVWGCEHEVNHYPSVRVPNGMGLYVFHSTGNRVLLYRDPEIGIASPIPVRPRKRPHVRPSLADWDGPAEGRFLLADVYHGLTSMQRGEVKALRIIAVPPKTDPVMDKPNLGHTREDPGKCVLGTVSVEADGSAYFRVPAGIPVFFQALDDRHRAVQTMRTLTHVQAGQTLGCIGCHESRTAAPPVQRILAATRPPSQITVGPPGSWPLRFDRLVQPVLDRYCVKCHTQGSTVEQAAHLDLTADRAYETLSHFGRPSLVESAREPYLRGYSTDGQDLSCDSQLLEKLERASVHEAVELDDESFERLSLWIDTYVQKAGSFSPEQEQQLIELRRQNADLLVEREVPGGGFQQ